jgi:tetratricopeptide (TPR) repeat protein
MKEFFISYTKADQSWAEWIAWQLEQEGYTTVIQAWDFFAGSNFVSNMQNATADTDCTIAVISPAFFTSPYTEAEWTSAFASDPTGAKCKFVMVRVEDVELAGLLKSRVYIDLVGLTAKEASERLFKQLKDDRAKPDKPPVFPGLDDKSKAIVPRFPGELPPIWNIPFRRNPNFTGRDEYLSKLESELKSGSYTALTQAIRGMGGIGKTQIALEYAYRYSTNYQAIWWIRAEDERTLAANYAAFAIKANLPEKDAPEEQVVINAVQDWLEHNQKWLLIFDNAVRPEDVKPFLPKGASGHVLITSRHQAWEKLCRSFSIDIWPRKESVEFLINRTRDKNRSSAHSVAEELGDLPLALEQAAAFMNESGMGFDEYLELYQTRRNELWDEENPPIDYPDTVGTTWSLAIEKVQEEASAGALVLNLCAYLAPDEILRSLISGASEYLPEELSVHVNDSLALNKGIKALNQYSLVKAQPDSLSVHRLVQVVARDRLTTEEQKTYSEAAVQAVNDIFPSEGYGDIEVWPQCALLRSHGNVVIEHAIAMEVGLEPTADLLNSIALYLLGRASYSNAEQLFRCALEIYETQFEPGHPSIATSQSNLALALQDLGKYSEAKPLFHRALEIRETQLGADHPSVAQSLNNLASLLQDQGNYSEAGPLYRRALEIRETQLGANHPDVAQSLNDLASLLKVQGNYSEAEPLLRRALDIYETQLGGDHPDVAQSLNNLASLLQAQGNYSEAEPLYRRALDIYEKQLEADHPDVATSLNNLAVLLKVQGNYSEAEPLLRRALDIYEKQLGGDHPDVAQSLNNLASLLQAQDNYSEAEPFYRRALEIRETQLEGDHPDVAQSLNNLAGLLRDQGNYSEAEPLYRRALEIYETQLGADHPNTNKVRNNLENLTDKISSKNSY